MKYTEISLYVFETQYICLKAIKGLLRDGPTGALEVFIKVLNFVYEN